MNYPWHFLAATAALGIGTLAGAQTADERKALRQSVSAENLQRLGTELQGEFDRQEMRVRDYLGRNPGQVRVFQKNGATHYLSRLDAEGNPVYVKTRGGVNGTKSNRESGTLIKADQLYSGGSIGVNITGTGMVAGVWDPGLARESHELLAGQVANQAGQTMAIDNHMTHVSGTIVGKDIATRPAARGIAFGATALNYDSSNDLAEMAPFAARGYLISNHSYGLANDSTTPVWQFGAYDEEARSWDALLKNAPHYLPFVAGGNEQQTNGNMTKAGYDLISGASAAKNVMTVGAVNADKSMSDYSNWGPTDDGRMKPEIVARGTGIDSAQAFDTATPKAPCDNCYSGSGSDSSGTSYSAPAAAAAGLLLQQYYKSLNPNYMLSSTLKALMMGTAEDLGNPGPDHKFGWGLLNVEAAANAIKKSGAVGSAAASRGSLVMERTTNPAADSTTEETFTVYAKGGVPLVVNMAWIDDEGVEQKATDGVDPTMSRMTYEFDMVVRGGSPSADVHPWKIPSMVDRTANATQGTAWFDGNGDVFRQIIIGTPVVDGQYTIVIRKKAGSPATARTISFVITGLKESAVDTTAKTTMVEYLYASLGYYFLTSRANEIALLDSVPAFTRTGQSIPVFVNRAAGTQPITRFRFDKIALNGGRDGHFYTLVDGEISALNALNPTNTPGPRLPFSEGIDSYAYLPAVEGVGGSCAAGLTPVLRVFRGGARFPDDPNHRFTTSQAIYDEFVAKGWDGEGVKFCVPG